MTCRGLAAPLCVLVVGLAGPATAAAQQAMPADRTGDYADGHVLSILPPGANGLVNAPQALAFNATGTRPANSQDQLAPYADLLYGAAGLTDPGLPRYYNEESFGVRPGDVTRTEHPSPDVTIYRDGHGIPHIYGDTVGAMSFGAGYAAAEDRLFLIDVLRHYGSGTLSEFLGPSCADEKMDHDQLLLAPYSAADRQSQLDALPAQYGAGGAEVRSSGASFVEGINAYIARSRLDPSLVPAEYAAAGAPPQPWTEGDIVSIASLVGGIFGKGGGGEVRNAALVQYLQGQVGSDTAMQAFGAFKQQNDPAAPTTIVDRSFPYEIPSAIDRSLTAVPDDAAAAPSGGPTAATPGCDLTKPDAAALEIITSLLRLPKAMSNALVVDARHSASGHPTAVFGPQVGYFAPQILMQVDLHAPDFAAEGASFPGTNFIVELGRGADYAWSATSAGTDIVDQRLERICNPSGGPPDSEGKFYEFNGRCLAMEHQTFSETALTKPAGLGSPVVINHEIYKTEHGVVQGWTRSGGRPVAIVNQRSTYNHELDSAIGFLRWNHPSQTHDAASWFKGAEGIGYTFNWFYADDRDIAYYLSGKDPIRLPNVDPNLPTSGTGNAEWQGFLAPGDHPHEIDPKQGYFTSWNNKPAPGFSAADNTYSYGPVYRSLSLDQAIGEQLAAHGGKISRANLVSAMESAATVDLDGRRVLPALLPYIDRASQPAGVQEMLARLDGWLAAGAHRQKAAAGDAQYADAPAVAIMDELYPRLTRSLFDPLLAAGGVYNSDGLAYGYDKLPLDFSNTPNSQGQNLGSAYDDAGWEGYLVKLFTQLRGGHPGAPFPPAVLAHICGAGGQADCHSAVDRALRETFDALVAANGGSTSVGGWTQSTATKSAGKTMPAYDAIHFTTVGLVDTPAIDWQNRPTFQQVITFPRHRARPASRGKRRRAAGRRHRHHRHHHRRRPPFTG
ncbi:MAG: penicillin acylase family protein [Thermoleophilaceae bacterium]